MTCRIALACLFLVLLVPFLCAQEAGLVGTVTDPSGAVVAGATVTVQNVETNVERRVTTDEGGRYSISPLAIGRYTLTAEAPGFRTVTVSDIYLTIGQKGVADVTMQIGEVTEKVNVVDTAPLLQAEQASTGQSVENKKIVDLPLNGRDFVQLVALTPGATTAGTTYETQSSNVLINGQRSTKTTSTIDGVMNVDQLFQGFPDQPVDRCDRRVSRAKRQLLGRPGHGTFERFGPAEIGHEQLSRHRLRVSTKQRHGCAQLLPAGGFPPEEEPVRRFGRRADPARQVVLVRRVRGHPPEQRQ